ncbi:hypothetical protein BSL78_13740 [Apostichopus japonicus]|uniref:Uncharacterized protein n=1 Tax=Stichopus japonicus TaxID=307972 RepID=A0A2G8KN44_STIJA|nr:hypothetical protein BSL78_13740 [Apostichopus japonicus]
MADPDYYWIFMNFTTSLSQNTSNFIPAWRYRFSYEDELTFDRINFDISYIIRDNDGKPISAQLAFIIENTFAQDSGFYDVVLTKDSNMNASTIILHQTYRLFNSHSPSPTPVCSAVDTASLQLDVNADYLLNCTVLGYFYPEIELKIVSSSGECPYQIVNKTKGSLLAGLTTEHAYVTYCENTSFTCNVSQISDGFSLETSRFNYCTFQLQEPPTLASKGYVKQRHRVYKHDRRGCSNKHYTQVVRR